MIHDLFLTGSKTTNFATSEIACLKCLFFKDKYPAKLPDYVEAWHCGDDNVEVDQDRGAHYYEY